MTERMNPPTGTGLNDEPEAEQIGTIEAEIDETRDAITGDLRTVGERLSSPKHLKAEATQAVRNAKDAKETVREAKDNAMETVSAKVSELRDDVQQVERQVLGFIRDNAVPLALIGIGAAWLASNRRTRDVAWEGSYRLRDEERWRSRDPSLGPAGAAQRGMSQVADRVRDFAGPEADQARQVADQARQEARNAEHHVSEAASRVRDRAVRELDHAREMSRHAFESHPLAVGAAVVAAGIGIGLMLPSTRPESELLGDARERLVSGAKDALQDWTHAAKTAARDAKTSWSGNAT